MLNRSCVYERRQCANLNKMFKVHLKRWGIILSLYYLLYIQLTVQTHSPGIQLLLKFST